VKKRFKILPFKCNLQCYNPGITAVLYCKRPSRAEEEAAAADKPVVGLCTLNKFYP
jgi:hypothetical protein